ncbi:hypothetical protein TPHA_0D02290 [Tetrapisispora phaffii CBS 4417]|uniref:Ribosomal protein S15 n=1 Tax=Tetrapisispora phaffii (strain ATCC 24235 / CBS 4417 / NBRC 1672 / NRRL Y-8282 / UCD 70-5) TaxID=1071381 RepID=G8BSP6_TETPH|nr:mitochondrial 37S ribosomal protein MRPS28 TPHA_0D02290 [Tetrapisispora phaffii CBS 4417]CCE62867.1 hypothetical protein TPHA_0D02290 [Tetrapisispora phaffii CBS 4417]
MLRYGLLGLKPALNASIKRNLSGTGAVEGQKAIRYLKSQKIRQKNEAIQASIKNALDTVDPVLGKADTPFINRILSELEEKNVLAGGHTKDEVEKLIAAIEAKNIDESTRNVQGSLLTQNDTTSLLLKPDEKMFATRREAILRILNIKNSDSKNRVKLATRLAIKEFQRFEGDVGSSEVQAACMTIRIYNMARNLKEHHKNFAMIRSLRMLVQQRQSILRYLKRDNPEKYFWTIQKLGLSDLSVTKEFNMDRQYMQDFKFYGDKILVKESKNETERKRKEVRKQKKLSKNSASIVEENSNIVEIGMKQ